MAIKMARLMMDVTIVTTATLKRVQIISSLIITTSILSVLIGQIPFLSPNHNVKALKAN